MTTGVASASVNPMLLRSTPQPDTAGPTALRSPGSGPGAHVMPSGVLVGGEVVDAEGNDVAEIVELMIDIAYGRVAYAVIRPRQLGTANGRLIVVPWRVLRFDTEERHFVLDLSREALRTAPAFKKGCWPSMANVQWARAVHAFYGVDGYWR